MRVTKKVEIVYDDPTIIFPKNVNADEEELLWLNGCSKALLKYLFTLPQKYRKFVKSEPPYKFDSTEIKITNLEQKKRKTNSKNKEYDIKLTGTKYLKKYFESLLPKIRETDFGYNVVSSLISILNKNEELSFKIYSTYQTKHSKPFPASNPE